MSLSIDGVWKAGVWATTVWADGVWREGAPTPPPAPATAQFSGGFDYPMDRRAKKYDIPPEAQAVIEAVVERQAAHPPADEERRLEELERELTLRGLEWEVRYLNAMNQYREALLSRRQRNERLLLLIAAAL